MQPLKSYFHYRWPSNLKLLKLLQTFWSVFLMPKLKFVFIYIFLCCSKHYLLIFAGYIWCWHAFQMFPPLCDFNCFGGDCDKRIQFKLKDVITECVLCFSNDKWSTVKPTINAIWLITRWNPSVASCDVKMKCPDKYVSEILQMSVNVT